MLMVLLGNNKLHTLINTYLYLGSAVQVNKVCTTKKLYNNFVLMVTLRLRSTGHWKPFCDLQIFVVDSIMNMRYVIFEKC